MKFLFYAAVGLVIHFLYKQSRNRDQDIDTFMDFPWYIKNHTRPEYKRNLTTTHLTSREHQQLEIEAVQRAKKLALKRFNYTTIQGTALSSQQSEKVRNTTDCWTQGTWIQDDQAFQLTHIQDPIYTCKRTLRSYRWQSLDCPPLEPVDREQWCHILNGRNMLIVGDLPQYQYHEALLDTFRKQPTVCYGELNCKDHTICKETKLRYIRNDVLSTHRSFPHKAQSPVNIVKLPFMSANIISLYPIIILSRTAVLDESDMTFTRRLIQSLKVIRETTPNALVFYKSSFIGHPFCNDAQSPLDTSLSDEELRRLPFGWSETRRRNAIARVIVEAAGGVYLDFASMVDKRPDAHVGDQDCVRYCIPGPLDATVQVLYNVFLLLNDYL